MPSVPKASAKVQPLGEQAKLYGDFFLKKCDFFELREVRESFEEVMKSFLSVKRTTIEEKEGLGSLRHWRVSRLETLKRGPS